MVTVIETKPLSWICFLTFVLLSAELSYAQEQVPSDATTIEGITNFVQINPKIGTSGQPSKKQFSLIADAGYSIVINLTTPDSRFGISDEGSVVTSLGLTYINIPVRFEVPTLDDLRLFIRTMNALDGEKVWVHCAMNARVSAFMYHYLKNEKNLSEDEARTPLLERMLPRMPEVWKAFLKLTKDDIYRD